MRHLEYELGKIANFIINDMFRVQRDEVVVITSDSASNHDVVDAIATATHVAGGKVIVMQTPRFKGRVKLVDESIPTELYVQALSEADIWIDANAYDFLYSETWERIMAANTRLRYILLGDLSTDVMAKMYGGYRLQPMIEFCNQLKAIVETSSTVTVKNPQGTNISFEIEPTHFIAIDSGEITKPGLYTPPALVNIVPRFGSVNGIIFFDAMYEIHPDKVMEEPLALTIENSTIVSAAGNRYADQFMIELANWNDDNLYKVAHMNFGLLPTVREMIGHIVIDERVWGITNWGFGSVSPLDAPPDGQPCIYHLDAVCSRSSVWIDGLQLTERGEVIHPPLKLFSDQFLV